MAQMCQVIYEDTSKTPLRDDLLVKLEKPKADIFENFEIMLSNAPKMIYFTHILFKNRQMEFMTTTVVCDMQKA